jgi:hypothetical protein
VVVATSCTAKLQPAYSTASEKRHAARCLPKDQAKMPSPKLQYVTYRAPLGGLGRSHREPHIAHQIQPSEREFALFPLPPPKASTNGKCQPLRPSPLQGFHHRSALIAGISILPLWPAVSFLLGTGKSVIGNSTEIGS